MSAVRTHDVVAEEIAEPRQGLVALRSANGTALIATTVLASMVGFLDANVINVAVPAIGHQLAAHAGAVQWIRTAAPRLAPHPRTHACALPVPEPAATPAVAG